MTEQGSGLVDTFAALGDETRWRILIALGERDASASALAGRLPVSRQAIAKHLAILEDAGLVSAFRVGRELRYRALGAPLAQAGGELLRIGGEWERRRAAAAVPAADALTGERLWDRSTASLDAYLSTMQQLADLSADEHPDDAAEAGVPSKEHTDA